MIKRFASMIQTAVKTVISEKELECTIDDQIIDCKSLEAPIHECGPSHFSHGYSPYGNIPVENRYIGVPAPTVLADDPWFGAAPKTEKAMEYVLKKNEELYHRLAEEPKQKEPENIHQVMYEMATKNWNTVKETQGGSENFQEGPGGWNSGTGMGQFK